MLERFIVGSVLTVAVLAATAPSASALVPKGTYPNQAAAVAACKNGIARGWWDNCRYSIANPQTGTVQIWTNR